MCGAASMKFVTCSCTVLKVLVAAFLVMSMYSTGIYAQSAIHNVSCEHWFNGKIAGYQFWGRADSEAIRNCVAKYGVNRRNPFHATPLLHALAHRHVSISTIELLISLGADVNAKNRFHVTPLIMASRYVSDPEIIIFLVTKGARREDRDVYGVQAKDLIQVNPALTRSMKADLENILTPHP